MAEQPAAEKSKSHPLAAAFNRAAQFTSKASGHPVTFATACAIVVLWIVSGPVFHYSDTWQLVINTGTTIVTFLMVFLIQNTQNRDMTALQLKLDELIRANQGARNALLALEDLSEEDQNALKARFAVLADGGVDPDAAETPQDNSPDSRQRA